jgi:hypothetical protein
MMTDLTKAILGNWYDGDDTYSFYDDGTFEHEWHVNLESNRGAYELQGSLLAMIYWEDQRVWEIVDISATTMTVRNDGGEYTLNRIG